MKVTMTQVLRGNLLLLLLVLTAAAQQSTNELTPVIRLGEKSPDTTDERYRIGPGDLLEVRVFNRPQLSRDAVRVDARGIIRMPLIETEIQAACHTEGEVARAIREHYLKYQRNPQVDVFIKEFNSQPVAVLGAVDKPGRFQLQRRIRLAELISLAGGPTDKAGKRIQVAHSSARSICRQLNPITTVSAEQVTSEPIDSPADDPVAKQDTAQIETTDYDIYNLNDTLRSDDASNPYVLPGDVITVPEAEQAYVVGNVFKPTTIPLKEPTTVSQAIAMAGGALPDTKTNRIRIIRKVAGESSKVEIFVSLPEIVKQRAVDVVLDPGDIIEVPVSAGKRMMRTIYSAIGPAFGNLPIYVLR
jgi:polysaccharide biosynthesis/export protein